MSLLKQIDEKYQELYDQVKKLYDESIDSDEWKEKLTEHVDYRVLYPTERYSEFQQEVRKDLEELFKRDLKENFKEYVKIMIEMLEEEKNFLSLETIGTTLNVMREFYNDIRRDMKYHYVLS